MGDRGKLLVFTGVAPLPAEQFIQRDLTALRAAGWQTQLFGLNQRRQSLRSLLHSRQSNGRQAGWRTVFAAANRRLYHLFASAVARLARRNLRQAIALGRSWRLVVAANAAAAAADIVVAHFAWLTADIAAVVAEANRKPLVIAVHAWDLFTQPEALLRLRLQPAAAVVACSTAALERVLATGVTPPERAFLVHHGLPLAEFPYRSKQPAAVQRLIGIGRLEAKKGFDLLLQAVALLHSEGLSLQVDLVGSGAEERALTALTQTLQLEQQVAFHGTLSQAELKPLLAQAEILVLPSRITPSGDRDGIANVLLEALALGVPVVTTTAGSAAEVISNHTNGILVPPDDLAALTAAIRELSHDCDLRCKLAANGRTSVVQNFDLTENIRTLCTLLDRLQKSQQERDKKVAVDFHNQTC